MVVRQLFSCQGQTDKVILHTGVDSKTRYGNERKISFFLFNTTTTKLNLGKTYLTSYLHLFLYISTLRSNLDTIFWKSLKYFSNHVLSVLYVLNDGLNLNWPLKNHLQEGMFHYLLTLSGKWKMNLFLGECQSCNISQCHLLIG